MFLAPLVRCSRRLNNVVGPLLYRTFTQSLTKPASLPNLLRMVMEKPAVGAEIKNLVLMEPYFHEGLSMSSYLPQDFDRCIFAIRSFEISINKMNWIQTIGRGEWDAVVALLLFYTPSLEGIKIASSGLSHYIYLNQICLHIALNQRIRNPIGQAHSLEKLRNYSIDHRGPSPRIGIRTILPWCAVLSMHTIRIAMLEQEDDWDPSPFPKQYHVQNLRITNSSVDGMIMRTLLGRFVSLQKFYYHHGSAELTDFIFQAIGEGLAHLHDSLEELVLLGTLRDVLSGDLGREPVGSLAEFTKLRCIGTEAEVLFGPDNYVW
ncbi:hypothetical protein L207DRAFT_588897 [Hyaloscypha variabilis F]|uniref:F-box domain-containing protein n=1 Tax=Hyaloscypha variabilis (strain UAMH 11265 / GT02V1 / F) TaxID=1149755 RepID=A0A2J6R716_HYAVF|nr:hypothetical protein L207DRAFT_588897 [Hyaloscypha variabilis F]